MKNYKGFSIPESKEELFEKRSNPTMPTITVCRLPGNDGTVRLNIPLSVEDAVTLSFDEINEKIMNTIDTFVESWSLGVHVHS